MNSITPGYSRPQSTIAWLFSSFTESFDMEYGVPSSVPSCSQATRKKLDRALAILGLQPCLHHSQQSLLAEGDGMEWPKPATSIRKSNGWNFGL